MESAKSTKETCEALCTIWYHLYNFKNVKITDRGVIFFLKLQASKGHTYLNKPTAKSCRFV